MKSPYLDRLRLFLAGGALLAAHSLIALPVFPGAVGFGTNTPAGRGGSVYRVTNLNNSGSGSLRYGLESVTGPRVIIFDVSGVIDLQSDLVIRDDSVGDYGNVTVAGQTAPYPGITLKGGGIDIRSHDVLIQHIAIRPGNGITPLDNRDCIKIGAPPGVTTENIVIDHVTATWAVDETTSLWSDNGTVRNVTISNSILAHPIINGGHSKGSHGYGPLSGRHCSNVTIIRNIMAFNSGRNPLVRDTTSGAQVVNNFVYRPGPWPNSAMYFGDLTVSPHAVSVIGNVIKRHPIPFTLDHTDDEGVTAPITYTTYYNTSIYVHDVVSANAGFYLADNRVFNPQTSVWHPTDSNPWNSSIFRDSSVNPVDHLSSDPYVNSGGTTWSPWSSSVVEANLLANAGKQPAQRDYYDAELINDIQSSSGQFLEYLSDLGSNPWAPVSSGTTRVLTLPSNPNGDDDSDGYTNLEEWLHGWADTVENAGGSLDAPAVISDDFEDGNANGWTADGGTWQVITGSDDVYKQTDTAATANRSTLTGTNWTDQVIEADVKATAVNGSNRFFGVVARYRNPNDYYYFVLRTNNTIELKKLAGGAVTLLDSASFTVALNTTYRLKLEAVGTTLRGYINGTLQLEATDSQFASGKLGLLTYLSAVEFDDVLAHPNQTDITPPTVSVTAPTGGATVSGTVNITASASDDVGVVGVQFKIDGQNLGAEDTNAPYSISWDTTSFSNGSHAITAVARDASNSTTSTAVNVTVANGGGSSVAYAEDFSDGQAQDWTTVAGTWSVASGYYQQTANDYPDIAVYDGATWATDFTYAASLRTSWSATNNRVGMIYNYVDANNYYYVIFNAAGLAEINRVISGGSPVVVASGSYTGGGSGVWFDVEVLRSGTNTTVLVNGSPVFSNVSQTELGGGKIGLITRFNASARFDDLSVSTAESAAVFDTFEDGNANGWTTDGGTWSVVADGTNVYRQTNNTTSAVRSVIDATAGWTDQVIESDVKLVSVDGSNRFFGLVARYNNSNSYYYFILRTNNTIELKKLENGISTTLDSGTFTVSTGTWYSLKLEAIGSSLKAYINGSLQLEALDGQYTSGKAGVLTYHTAVSFDDVYADTAQFSPVLVADDFQDGNANGWTPNGTSSWSVVTDGTLAYRQTDTSDLAMSTVGSTSWTDQIIEIDAKALSFNFDTSNDRWFGVMARYTDANNYYYVTIRTTNEVHLRKMVNGTFTTLGTASFTMSTGTWYVVKLKAIGNSLKVYMNGELKLQATDSSLPAGKPGLIMYKGSAVFDDVIVSKP